MSVFPVQMLMYYFQIKQTLMKLTVSKTVVAISTCMDVTKGLEGETVSTTKVNKGRGCYSNTFLHDVFHSLWFALH